MALLFGQDELKAPALLDAREARGTTPPVPPAYYVCWTINRTCEMRYLMRLGVSGILTDFPTLRRRLLHRQIRQDARRAARSARQQARRAP